MGPRVVAAMSVVRDLILQADDQLRYPSGGELRSMVDFLKGGIPAAFGGAGAHRKREKDRG
jgi:hypothetical protein